MKSNKRTIENYLLKKETENRELSPLTKERYGQVLNRYSRIIKKPLQTSLQEAQEEQIPYINKRNQIIIPRIENTTLYNDILTYIQYSRKTHRTDNGLTSDLATIKTFYNTYNIKTPKIKLNKYKPKIKLLTKPLIKTALNLCRPNTRIIYHFLMSTGIRVGDMVNFTIDDFLEATNITSINNLIICDPREVGLGYWEFQPKKTKNSSGIICKTCSTSETNQLIIEYLKERNTIQPLDSDDYLFLNIQLKKHKPKNIATNTQRISMRLYNTKLKEYEQLYNTNQITKKKFNELKDNIPKFHCHGLRKYFISVLANHGVPVRVSAVMEGHTPPIVTDTNYVDISKETVMNEYFKLIPYLSIEPTKVKVLNSKDKQDFEDLKETVTLLKKSLEINDKLINIE